MKRCIISASKSWALVFTVLPEGFSLTLPLLQFIRFIFFSFLAVFTNEASGRALHEASLIFVLHCKPYAFFRGEGEAQCGEQTFTPLNILVYSFEVVHYYGEYFSHLSSEIFSYHQREEICCGNIDWFH